MSSSRTVRFAGLAAVDEETTTTAAEETTTTTALEVPDPAEQGTANFVAFFENFTGDLTLLQDGDTFADEAIQPMRDRAAAAGSITVNVVSVTQLDDAGCQAAGETPPCATVIYDLVVNGDATALPGQTGHVVFQDGAWKVAKSTFCGLAQLGGLPEGC